MSDPAGFDTEDLYDDVDRSDLRTGGAKPLRSSENAGSVRIAPQFEDSVLKHEVVDSVETELDVEIKFVKYLDETDDWTILVDGELVDDVGYHRTPEEFSVFEMDSDSFETLVRSQIFEPESTGE